MPDTDERLAAIEERLARIETKLDLLPFAFPNAPIAESRTTSVAPQILGPDRPSRGRVELPDWCSRWRTTPYEYENTGEGPAL